jgi:phosphate butyryltransferase
MITRLKDLLEQTDNRKLKLVVVSCHDEEVLEAVFESYKLGIIEPILIGDMDKTYEIAKKQNFLLDNLVLINELDMVMAAEIGVKMVSKGEADFIMKGLLDTSTLLKAVLNKEWGLRSDSLLSHVMIYDVSTYHKLLYLTDGGMNIAPNVEEKEKIMKNACIVAKALGNTTVKVAILAAKEKVDSKMNATIDANWIAEKYNNSEYDGNIIVDGPLALDIALSREAADIKGVESRIAGDADILLVPNIEMGNGIGKAITYLAKGKSAGIVMGAKAPIVLASRSDDHITKLYSIALGKMVASKIYV